MLDFIPVGYYSLVFYIITFVVSIICSFYISRQQLPSHAVSAFSEGLGYFLVVICIVLIGVRQPSFAFGDTGIYAKAYKQLQGGTIIQIKSDFIFNYFMLLSSKIMSVRMFFFLISVGYVFPMYLFCKRFCGSIWGFALLACIVSFTFWPYGVNGIRNGLATSIFLLGLVYYDRKWLMYMLLAISYGIHNSLIIPIAAFVVSGLYKNPRIYLYLWILSIPASILGGAVWENLFAGFSGDDRVDSYLGADALSTLEKNEGTTFSSTGFRWDFLLFSILGVIPGWYLLVKKKVQDKFYIHLWGTYLVCNAFWVLVIRAAFSNRFSYLSWFMIALVVMYPLSKYRVGHKQSVVVGAFIFLFSLFTFYMYIKTGNL